MVNLFDNYFVYSSFILKVHTHMAKGNYNFGSSEVRFFQMVKPCQMMQEKWWMFRGVTVKNISTIDISS